MLDISGHYLECCLAYKVLCILTANMYYSCIIPGFTIALHTKQCLCSVMNFSLCFNSINELSTQINLYQFLVLNNLVLCD